MQSYFSQRGFLPPVDPAVSFQQLPQLTPLDEIGRNLPHLLLEPGFRKFARELDIPPWPHDEVRVDFLRELRLYYVRIGFLASGYINQVGQEPVAVLPRNIAAPLVRACTLLDRPPILSYDGYALYNWYRYQSTGPIALNNIDTIQNFVHLYDECWFILIHVAIEAIAADILQGISRAAQACQKNNDGQLDSALKLVADAVWRQVAVLKRIPEHMDPALYHRTFRPYIRFFENVVYEGVAVQPMQFRGETGAQSSIMPALVAFLKIHHKRSALTDHLADMRRFMPAQHRTLLKEIDTMPSVRGRADKRTYNNIIEAIATFREVHLGWAKDYIGKWSDDLRGTGGTPYMQWLQQLIDETRAQMLR